MGVIVKKITCNWTGSKSSFLKYLATTDSFSGVFDLLYFRWFRSWKPWFQSTLQTLGIILIIIVIVISLAHYILSKALNACSLSLTRKQVISLRLEWQKRNKENGQLINCALEVVACEYQRLSKKCHDLWIPYKGSATTTKTLER